MSCYHPLFRISSDLLDSPFYRNKPGYAWLFRRIRNKGAVISKFDFDNRIDSQDRDDFQRIPCGRCVGCRLDYSRQWADRIMLESLMYSEDTNWFFTITYKDQFLPAPIRKVYSESSEVFDFFPLRKSDLQKFFKLLRIRYKREYGRDLKLRYFSCGEYGDKTYRPHYHACMMNLPLFDLRESDMFCQKRFGRKIGVLYESDFINSCWIDSVSHQNKGGIAIGRLTWSSAAYVARYIFKKQLGRPLRDDLFYCVPLDSDFYDLSFSDVLPFPDQFTCMSLKPGIASQYYDDHKEEILLSDSVPVHKKDSVLFHKPPRYFDSKTKQLFPDEFSSLQSERRSVAIAARLMELEQISMSEDEFLRQQEEIKMRQISKLARSL